MKQDDYPLTTKCLRISCSERLPLFSGHMPQGFLLGALLVWIWQPALLPGGAGGLDRQHHTNSGGNRAIRTLRPFAQWWSPPPHLIPPPQPSFLGKIAACTETLLCKEHLCPPVWWITDLQKEQAKGRPREGWSWNQNREGGWSEWSRTKAHPS